MKQLCCCLPKWTKFSIPSNIEYAMFLLTCPNGKFQGICYMSFKAGVKSGICLLSIRPPCFPFLVVLGKVCKNKKCRQILNEQDTLLYMIRVSSWSWERLEPEASCLIWTQGASLWGTILAWERTPVPMDLHLIWGKGTCPFRLAPACCLSNNSTNCVEKEAEPIEL